MVDVGQVREVLQAARLQLKDLKASLGSTRLPSVPTQRLSGDHTSCRTGRALDNTDCVICMELPVQMKFMPCMHAVA